MPARSRRLGVADPKVEDNTTGAPPSSRAGARGDQSPMIDSQQELLLKLYEIVTSQHAWGVAACRTACLASLQLKPRAWHTWLMDSSATSHLLE